MKQNGFTLIEVLSVLVFFACLGVIGGIFFIGEHFVAKFW